MDNALTLIAKREAPENWGKWVNAPCDGCAESGQTWQLYETGAIFCRSCFAVMIAVDEEEEAISPEVDAMLTRAADALKKRGRIER